MCDMIRLDQKSLPVSGSMGLHMDRHYNSKYISLIKRGNNHSKKGRYFNVYYVTLYIPMGSTQIS